MKNPNTCRICNRGYTLVELLIVVSIIVILALLTLFMFPKFRESADKATSLRNIAQLQLANATYATDNNGQYLKVFAFDDEGKSYVPWFQNSDFLALLKGASVLMPDGSLDKTIPPNTLDPKAYRARGKWHDTFTNSYGYNGEGNSGNNGWGSPGGSRGGFRMSQLTAPERTAAFITATDWYAKYSGRYLWRDKPFEGYQNGKIAYRYKGKALVAYYDGHVGEVSMEDMKKIDARGGQRNIFWDADAK
jgi:prepilin-type N-terminal cleavage/methylation domain-containing protein